MGGLDSPGRKVVVIVVGVILVAEEVVNQGVEGCACVIVWYCAAVSAAVLVGVAVEEGPGSSV